MGPGHDSKRVDVDMDNSGDIKTHEHLQISDMRQDTVLFPTCSPSLPERASTTAPRMRSTSKNPWRDGTVPDSQAELVLQLIDQQHEPGRQQKRDLLKRTSLTTDRLNGILARARAISSKSPRAVRATSLRALSDDSSSDRTDVTSNREEKERTSEDVPDTIDPERRLASYVTILDWWLDNGFADIAAYFDDQDRLQGSYLSPESSKLTTFNTALDRPDGTVCPQDLCLSTHGAILSYRTGERSSTQMQLQAAHSGFSLPILSAPGAQSATDLFYCDVCDRFGSRNDSWNGHERERSMRLPLWVCKPLTSDVHGVPACTFCGQILTSHSCTHQTQNCLTSNDCTFQHQGEIVDHLIRVHNLDMDGAQRVSIFFKLDTDLDTNYVDNVCHLCGMVLASPDKSAKHIGDHFRYEGLSSAQ